jgi:hypothetical protein
VALQEIWIFLRPVEGKDVAPKSSWKDRLKAHLKVSHKIFDISLTSLMIISGGAMLICWSDFTWLFGATNVAQSLREGDSESAISVANTLAKEIDPTHTAETTFLTALADVAAGKEGDGEERLNLALEDLQSGKPNEQLKTAILNARDELARRDHIKRQLPTNYQGSRNDTSDKSLNLTYGPFVLNLQMPQASPKPMGEKPNASSEP